FGQWGDLIPRRWRLHIARGLISLLVLWLFVFSVKRLSLADAYSIFMSAPLLITALSVPLLREHVGWRRWLAVFVGLIGVLFVLKPTGANWITLGGLAAFGAAVGYALNVLMIKMLARSDTGAATVLWALVIMTVVAGLLSIPMWETVRLQHAGWTALLGLSAALGQYLITDAFRGAAPAVLAPVEYTALAWGVLFDYVLWHTMPRARMLIGASIIVASGLYVFRREQLVSR